MPKISQWHLLCTHYALDTLPINIFDASSHLGHTHTKKKGQKLVWDNGGFTERDEEMLEGKTLSVIIRMLLLR